VSASWGETTDGAGPEVDPSEPAPSRGAIDA